MLKSEHWHLRITLGDDMLSDKIQAEETKWIYTLTQLECAIKALTFCAQAPYLSYCLRIV
jgi:hypothetical protein